jgi:hypothetical protein
MMHKVDNIRLIPIDMTGANATTLLKGIPVSLSEQVTWVKSMRVIHNEKFGTEYSNQGDVKPVLVLDDVAKITFTFKDATGKIVIDNLPASSLCDLTDKQRSYYNCVIDFSKSLVNLQTAISGTPGWLLLEFEAHESYD